MKKGISAVIATILMLLITIALAGSAYMYISGMLTGKTSKTISVLDISCSSDGKITVVVSNDGTSTISSGEIKIFVGNAENTDFTWFGALPPHTTAVNTTTSTYDTGETHTILVVSPSNAVRQVVYC